jgi:hypothetical protein
MEIDYALMGYTLERITIERRYYKSITTHGCRIDFCCGMVSC